MRNDQIFTPSTIVTKMLDQLEYFGDNIKTKSIFEPSFGGGAFLKQITERIFEYSESNHLTPDETISILNNVHGVEIDPKWHANTVKMLTDICKEHGIDYNWSNLICGDTTTISINYKYDLCVGNPPFIRIHDLQEDERQRIQQHYQFGQGNTDLYVIFFELGIQSLKSDGKLCYITPNSFLKNSSQKQFRKYLSNGGFVKSITDYGIVPVFGKIATYTAITLLDMSGGHKETTYTMMKGIEKEDWTNTIKLSQLGEKPWSAASSSDEKFLKEIAARKTKLSDLCDIQYGLATNADKVYLVNKDDVKKFESGIIRPVVKGSTLNFEQCIIFPYEFNEKTKRYELIPEEKMKSKFPKTYQFLSANKTRLEIRDLEKGAVWYQYGRSQGIQNSDKCKFVVKHIVANIDNTCQTVRVDDNTLVYSGMFITMKNEENAELVRETLTSEEFCRYVKLVGKNMAGGYKSFNTAAAKNFGINDSASDTTKE
jgi:adenine-specific DNA-methyltransferase